MASSSDEDDTWDWRSHVVFQGIEDVPRSDKSSFEARNRGVIQQTLREAISNLKAAFPTEFGTIKGVQNPDDLAEPLQELVAPHGEAAAAAELAIPAGIAEFLTLTYETHPAASAEFGLPMITGTPHESRPSLRRIELDFDDELDKNADEHRLWVECSTSRPKKQRASDFGKVFFDTPEENQPAVVADSFEDLVVMWSNWLCGDFKQALESGSASELIEEFYADLAN
ncbi:hypothetical protein HDU87_002542 [Geranomyces variabilis]|uniref:Uncharacterized protein n=1 Tax=Geranomyces variabilis TaxID=109894 RepID=A0AAD5TRC4_9FUNG|nr:hypothetical protein HDU87_002542 [Geranomyces variabilis]